MFHVKQINTYGGEKMIIYDFEIFKYDWMVCWLDTSTRKLHHIVNDKAKLERFYEYYKSQIMVGYNSRNYDAWILKSILCDFNPWDMNVWLIEKEQKGFMFSKLLNKFPIMNYDCSVGFRGLKELEAFMGHDIRESSVPWNVNRKLTNQEIEETLKYCKHDVMETFHVFVETKEEFESHIGLIREYQMPLIEVNKTKAQLSAMILGAVKKKWNDEFEVRFPDTLQMGKYEWIKDWYRNWADNVQDYKVNLKTNINGVPHTLGNGGLHGAIEKYYGDGYYLMADVASYYPALMIEYDYLSRNVKEPKKYRQIRDERIVMKRNKDPRQQPRKIVLNGTFGASKDQYNNLYDPLQANNICIAGQLMLVDLLDKLDGKCQLIQSNTDGILVKLYSLEDRDHIISICNEWSKRTRMELEFEDYRKVIQKDVNNYIIVDDKGEVKRKGAYVKKLSVLDNDLPIVNKAIVDYFIKGTPVKDTILASDNLIDFQKITKISSKYECASYNGVVLNNKVYRCFASLDSKDGSLYKKHKSKDGLDKTPSTPVNCFIDNSDITDKKCPPKLDKQWYIDLANERIKDFVGR